MTCDNKEICPMQERDNCICNFVKELAHKLPNYLIWLLPILLTLAYLIFYLLLDNKDWIKELKPSSTLIGVFFGGTLTYYGVVYTLTYRIKIEVLSKNRQEWINNLRNELAIYFSYFSELSLTVYDGPSIQEYQIIQKKINQTYNKIFFYLNKNEYISYSLLFVMREMQQDSKRLGYLIEISEDMKTQQYTTQSIINVIHLYNTNYNVQNCHKIIQFFTNNPHQNVLDISQAQFFFKSYQDEIKQAYKAIQDIQTKLNSKNKYFVKIPNNYKHSSTILHQELQELFQKLATICLKEEWERVKKAR